MKTIKNSIWLGVASIILTGLTNCTKPEMDDDFPPGDPPPVEGGFVNSDEISPSTLVAHFSFEGNVNDVKNAVTGGAASGTTSFTAGVKGQAYQGSANGFIGYTDPGPLAGLTSFTVSLWVNTAKHPRDAQGVFALSKQDGSFWSNFFMMIEGNNSSDNKMFMKFHFENNTATFVEHWIEPFGDFRPDDMYNGWRHIALSYDAATSKVAWYVNGQKKNLPPNAEDRKANSAGDPLGPLSFKNPTRFIIGGMQNHLGAPYNAPETWMLNYTGKLDEFRIYNSALTSQEVSALQILERQGR
ncbi:LamG domain-containing protein [Flavihumibacter sp. R14]|nr:LamG domain-containing protein [Flavihumibacter soli]